MVDPFYDKRWHLFSLWEQSLRISTDLEEARVFFVSLLPRGSSADLRVEMHDKRDFECLRVQIPKRSIVDSVTRNPCSVCGGEGVMIHQGHMVPCRAKGCPGPPRPENRVNENLPIPDNLLDTDPESRKKVLDHERTHKYGRWEPPPFPPPSPLPPPLPTLLDEEFDFS